MDKVKYPFLLVGILAAEILLVYAFFLFVTLAKTGYVLFSAILILIGIVYLAVSRYRERVKIKPEKEVRKSILRVSATAAGVVIIVFAGIVILRAVVFLIHGS